MRNVVGPTDSIKEALVMRALRVIEPPGWSSSWSLCTSAGGVPARSLVECCHRNCIGVWRCPLELLGQFARASWFARFSA